MIECVCVCLLFVKCLELTLLKDFACCSILVVQKNVSYCRRRLQKLINDRQENIFYYFVLANINNDLRLSGLNFTKF